MCVVSLIKMRYIVLLGKNQRYIFTLLSLPPMNTVVLLVVDILRCIAYTISYKFMSYKKLS
jgi:hypothetical protein